MTRINDAEEMRCDSQQDGCTSQTASRALHGRYSEEALCRRRSYRKVVLREGQQGRPASHEARRGHDRRPRLFICAHDGCSEIEKGSLVGMFYRQHAQHGKLYVINSPCDHERFNKQRSSSLQGSKVDANRTQHDELDVVNLSNKEYANEGCSGQPRFGAKASKAGLNLTIGCTRRAIRLTFQETSVPS